MMLRQRATNRRLVNVGIILQVCSKKMRPRCLPGLEFVLRRIKVTDFLRRRTMDDSTR